mgnify:FL=1
MSKLVEALRKVGRYEIAADELLGFKRFINQIPDLTSQDGINSLNFISRYSGHALEFTLSGYFLAEHYLRQNPLQKVDTLETMLKVGASIAIAEGIKYLAHRLINRHYTQQSEIGVIENQT